MGDYPGGDGRTRTGGILLAKQALYQLSYAPRWGLVGLTGIEPVTSSLSGTRSNQLSYKPGFARKGRGTLRREARPFQLILRRRTLRSAKEDSP